MFLSGDGIRNYLAGPPGAPGTPGTPGPAGYPGAPGSSADTSVEEVAARVLGYIQSRTEATVSY